MCRSSDTEHVFEISTCIGLLDRPGGNSDSDARRTTEFLNVREGGGQVCFFLAVAGLRPGTTLFVCEGSVPLQARSAGMSLLALVDAGRESFTTQ